VNGSAESVHNSKIRRELERLMREQLESVELQTFGGLSEEELDQQKARLKRIREVSADYLGALTFEIRLQYSRNPARCQRTTVSGVTTRRDFFQSDQNRHASTQKSLSEGKSVGLACLRFSTASC
jgi:hypothetical protein